MATYANLKKQVGGDAPVILGVVAIADLPAASTDLTGAVLFVTGTAHATETSQLAVCTGTAWKYLSDGVTTVS